MERGWRFPYSPFDQKFQPSKHRLKILITDIQKENDEFHLVTK